MVCLRRLWDCADAAAEVPCERHLGGGAVARGGNGGDGGMGEERGRGGFFGGGGGGRVVGRVGVAEGGVGCYADVEGFVGVEEGGLGKIGVGFVLVEVAGLGVRERGGAGKERANLRLGEGVSGDEGGELGGREV